MHDVVMSIRPGELIESEDQVYVVLGGDLQLIVAPIDLEKVIAIENLNIQRVHDRMFTLGQGKQDA